jgi:DNA (cytosine-5)-methyltransferase 1
MSRNYSFTHGSLFSGIGGFDLAAEWMGWENIFHCEWNAFGQKVLKHYWPNAISYEDITSTDFTIHRGRIDILTGGFPCQPYSAAGKRLGKEDDRHLWPEMLRAIREIQPMYVVGENVRGLTNWNGGVVFDEVQADLEAQGYEVLPFLLPACAVNAPHRRDRIWFVAKDTNQNGWRSEQRKKESSFGQFGNIGTGDNERIQANDDKIGDASDTNSNGFNECDSNNEINASEGGLNALGDTNQSNGNGDASNTNSNTAGPSGKSRSIESNGCRNNDEQKLWREQTELNTGSHELLRNATNSTSSRRREDNRIRKSRFNDKNSSSNNWQNFPTVSPICIGDDGLSNRLDSITFPKWRNESIKAGGNAIVPQVAYQIFKALSK